MKYIGYIAIVLDIVFLNIHLLYENVPAVMEYYNYDAGIAAVITIWIFVVAILMRWPNIFGLAQTYSVMWLGFNHAFDFFQVIYNGNICPPQLEWLIFLVGLILIHVFPKHRGDA